jgi:dUTP pyrophosphatase
MLNQIRVKTLRSTLDCLPSRGTDGAAGLDLKAAIDEPTLLASHISRKYPCGFAIEIPHGYVGLICPRSGLATKYNITVMNAPGVIDSDYRGEIAVTLVNHGDISYLVQPGERIAQLLIMPVEMAFTLLPVAELSDTTRGDKGFGSTGKI